METVRIHVKVCPATIYNAKFHGCTSSKQWNQRIVEPAAVRFLAADGDQKGQYFANFSFLL